MINLYVTIKLVRKNDPSTILFDYGLKPISIPYKLTSENVTVNLQSGNIDALLEYLDDKFIEIPIITDPTYSSKVAAITTFKNNFIPNLYTLEVNDGGKDSYDDCTLIYINQDGSYMARDISSIGGQATTFKIYDSSNNLLYSGCPFNGDVYPLNNPNLYPCWLSVYNFSGFPFSTDNTFYASGINPYKNKFVLSSLTNSKEITTIIDYLNGCLTDPIPPTPQEKDDPYAPGGTTEEGGGEGTFDDSSTPILPPNLSESYVIETGFIRLYTGYYTSSLNALATYLWSPNGLDLDAFKKIFADPMSSILGLSLVPCSVSVTEPEDVVLGNVNTGVKLPRVTEQFVTYDLGSLSLKEYWGGYLDYSPYTSVEIYLPFIGVKPLNTDDVMGHTLRVTYNIDLVSGACCAFIHVAGSILYQFLGQCSVSVPVTGRDLTQVVNGVLSVVGAGAGTMLATGGNVPLAGASTIGALASSVTASKPKVEKSGSMGGAGGLLGVRQAYLIVTRPRQAVPLNQNQYTGYPSYMTVSLGDLVGYTEVQSVHIEGITATDAEKQEIENLLKSGVIL